MSDTAEQTSQAAAEAPAAPEGATRAPAESSQPQGEAAQEPTTSQGETVDDIRAEYERKVQRALGDRKKLERAQVEKDRKIKELERKFDGIDPDEYKRLKAYVDDPSQLVRDGVLSAEKLVELNKGYLSGDLQASSEAEKLIQQQAQEMETLKAELEGLKGERTQEKQSVAFKNDVKQLESVLTAEDGGYPLLAALGAAEGITQQVYDYVQRTGETPSADEVHELLGQREQAIANDMLKCLQTPAGIEAVKSNDELKAALVEALTGEKTEAPADETPEQAQQESSNRAKAGASTGARTVTTDAIAQAATRATGAAQGKTPRANKARAVEALRRINAQKKEKQGRV